MKQKRITAAALAIAACLYFGGCAKAQSASEPINSASTESGASGGASSAFQTQTDPNFAGKIQTVEIGQSTSADLDGDGSPETITYQIQPDNEEQPIASFTVNGTEYAASLPDMDAWFISPDTGSYYIADLDAADGMQEIALMDLGPSDDPVTYFFRWQNGELSCLGSVSDLISNDSFAIPADGTVTACGRLAVLQTWQTKFTWALQDGTLQQQEQSSYVPYYYEGYEPTVTLQQPLKVYEQADTASPYSDWMPSEEPITFLSTDNRQWVELSRGKEHGWLHLTDVSTLDNDGLTNADDVFYGLFFAD